jgi:hypothetical protein
MVARKEGPSMAKVRPNRLRLVVPAALALALALQGCASMSKNECLNADWYAIGYESGIRGQHEAQISEHRKACAEYGVTPDLARFLEGRNAGLQRFCEPRNGYRLGRAGTAYAGVCPQRLEGEFLQAYGAGREIYDSQQNINRLGRRIDSRQADLRNLNEELADRQAELIASGTTPQRRALLLGQMVELQDKIKTAERDIHHARAERDHERERLAQLQRGDAAW